MKNTLMIKIFMGCVVAFLVIFCAGFIFTIIKNNRGAGEKSSKIKSFLEENSKRIKITVNSVALVVTLAFCVASSVLCAIDVNKYITIINTDFRKENATFIRYEQVESDHVCYNLFYEFKAQDGTIYEGKFPIDIVNFDYVESKIGKDMPIYVDYATKTHLLELNFNCYYAYVFGGCAVLFFALLMYFLYKLIVSCKKYREIPESELDMVLMVRSKKPHSYVLLHLMVGIIALASFLICCNFLTTKFNDLEINKNANFVQEEATIVYYERKVDGDLVIFPVYYEYVSDNMTYSGYILSRSTNEDKVRDMLGDKVPIFIEHNLERQSMTMDFSPTGLMKGIVVVAGILLGLILLSVIKITLYCKKLFKHYSTYKAVIKKYGLGD